MRYSFLVHSSPTTGMEAAYNEWYNNQHISDLLKIPGVISARRFKLSAANVRAVSGLAPYLAIYEIETDDLQGVFDEIARRRGTPAMVISEALDMAGVTTAAYELIYERGGSIG